VIRALFFDLDGTLLSGQKRILPGTREALRRCREKEIMVYLATARSPMLDRMLKWTENEFSLFDGGIYCNGACGRAGEQAEYAFLPADVVHNCVEQAAQFKDVHLALHLENEAHAFNHVLPDRFLDFWGIDREDIAGLDESCYARTVKVLIYFNSMVDAPDDALPIELYENLCRLFGDSANIYLSDSGKTIQVVKKGVSKYSAIEAVRKKLGIERDEVAVFGDDVNDIEMLSSYKNSVAMGNAVDEVKRIAGYTTLSNDEEGIAYAIENILRII